MGSPFSREAPDARPLDVARTLRRAPSAASFFAGEDFADLADAQRRVEQWCATTAALRVHGTTAQRPAEHFAAAEQALPTGDLGTFQSEFEQGLAAFREAQRIEGLAPAEPTPAPEVSPAAEESPAA